MMLSNSCAQAKKIDYKKRISIFRPKMKEERNLPPGVLKTVLMNELKGLNCKENEVYLETYLASLDEAKKVIK